MKYYDIIIVYQIKYSDYIYTNKFYPMYIATYMWC